MSCTIRLLHGDCLLRLLDLDDDSVGLFLTDPPYDLTSAGASDAQGGFMGHAWDSSGIAFNPKLWELVKRKLHPEGLIKSFGGTRTYHRMVRAMRLAGLEAEQLHGWVHGQGFPKSTNISKRLDRLAKVERKIVGYKQGVGGENLNDIVNGKAVRSTKNKGGKGVGAYGTGAKQVAVMIPITAPGTPEAELWEGYGTATTPSWEPIVIARRPR